jgi:hypothetical protein
MSEIISLLQPIFNLFFSFLTVATHSPWQIRAVFSCFAVIWLGIVIALVKEVLSLPAKTRQWSDNLFIAGAIALGLTLALFSNYSFSAIRPSQLLVALVPIGLVSFPSVILVLLIQKFAKNKFSRKLVQGLILLPWIIFVLAYVMILYEFAQPYPVASEYFKLNAAIKNTCLLDPQRDHCPQTLEEISYIEPVEFKRLSAKTNFVYTYNPVTNNYTFIARPRKDHAVIFDQRLIPLYGVDFKEYDVSTWWDKEKISNPPPFFGPWELPKWEDKPIVTQEPLDPARPETIPPTLIPTMLPTPTSVIKPQSKSISLSVHTIEFVKNTPVSYGTDVRVKLYTQDGKFIEEKTPSPYVQNGPLGSGGNASFSVLPGTYQAVATRGSLTSTCTVTVPNTVANECVVKLGE